MLPVRAWESFIFACTILALLSTAYGAFASGDSANQVATVTVGMTTITPQSQKIVDGAFKVVSIAGTPLACQLYNFTFQVGQGQYLSGNFTSDVPLNFYIVPQQVLQNWSASGSCGIAADAVASQTDSTTYSFNVALTNSGMWSIVLVNSYNRDADGFMLANLSQIGYTTTQPVLSTTTISPSTTASTPFAVPASKIEPIAIILLIGILVLVSAIVLVAVGYGRRKQ